MYQLEVLINQLDKRKRQSKALHYLAAILLLALSLHHINHLPHQAFGLFASGIACITILIVSTFFNKLLENAKYVTVIRIIEAVLIMLGAYYLYANGAKLIALSFALSSILIIFTLGIEIQLIKGYLLKINEAGITRVVGYKKILMPWNTIKNVIIKDEIITLDLANNYIMQCNLVAKSEQANEIMQFSQQQITSK
jgi:hypothetical protein